jgi:hypothetical protein
VYKQQIFQQIETLADQIARFQKFKAKLQSDFKQLVQLRQKNIIQVAKRNKDKLNSLQQSCLELLMNEKISNSEKLEMQLQVLELQLQT